MEKQFISTENKMKKMLVGQNKFLRKKCLNILVFTIFSEKNPKIR